MDIARGGGIGIEYPKNWVIEKFPGPEYGNDFSY
jgi:hypothetical protein